MFERFKKKDGENDQSKAEADLLVEALGAKIEEKFSKKFEAVDTLLGKWNKMEEEAAASLNEEKNRNARAAEENLTPEEKLANENKRLLMVSLLTNARITESEVVDEVKAQWPGLVPRIKEVMASIPMDDKVKPDYGQRCRNAVKLVIGDEAIKGGLRQNSDTKKFFLIDDAAGSTGGDESPFSDPDLTWVDPRNPNRAPMTAAEQLRKLRIDPKEFAEFVKRQGGLA
jgi:hypothetical protein